MRPLDDQRPGGSAEPVLAEAVSAEFLALGRVTGLFGVKGWVKVFSDTQPRENITHYDSWWLKSASSTRSDKSHKSEWREHKVVQARPHGKTIIALLDGVNSREAAAALIGHEVSVPRDSLPEAQDGEYYWTDLVGCKVVTVSGEAMGVVDRLFETGANDVLVVKSDRIADNGEVLIPWIVPDVITSIDINSRQLVVDWDPDY